MSAFGIDPYGGGAKGKVTYVGRNGDVTQTAPATPTAFNGTPPAGYATNPAKRFNGPGVGTGTGHSVGTSTVFRPGLGRDEEEEDESLPFYSRPLPGFARGGTLRTPGGYGIVGEEGPELIRNTSGSTQVIPLNAPARRDDANVMPLVPMPRGYKAPSPQYADRMNRVGEAADARRQRSANFQNSLDRERAEKKQAAGMFAYGKSIGASDRVSRRNAYLVSHGMPSLLPMPDQQAAAADPYAGVDPKAFEKLQSGLMSQAQQELRAAGYDTDARAKAQAKYDSAARELNNFRASRVGGAGAAAAPAPAGQPMIPFVNPPAAPTTQHTQPGQQPPITTKPMGSNQFGAKPGGPPPPSHPPIAGDDGALIPMPNQVEVTAQHLRAMWEAERRNNPNASPEEFQQRIAAKYGVQGGTVTGPEMPMTGGAPTVRGTMEQWRKDGTLDQDASDLVPGEPVMQQQIPMSLLGTDRSPQFSVGDGQAARVAGQQRYGAPGMKENGTTAGFVGGNRAPIAMPTVRERGPRAGYTPLAKAPTPTGRTAPASAMSEAPDGTVAFSPKQNRHYVRQGGQWVAQ